MVKAETKPGYNTKSFFKPKLKPAIDEYNLPQCVNTDDQSGDNRRGYPKPLIVCKKEKTT